MSASPALETVAARLRFDPAELAKGFRAADAFISASLVADKMGWPVIPTGENKVPRIRRWTVLATTALATIVKWQVQFGCPNFSMRTGEGFVVIDVDCAEDLTRMEQEIGPLPKTVKAESGREGGGFHLYFRLPPGSADLRTVAHVLGFKVDIRGWGGHCVLPGSKHRSGVRYRWADGCAPDEIEIAELPPAWYAALPKRIEPGEMKAASPRRVSPGPRVKINHDNAGSMVLGDGPDGGGYHGPINRLCIFYFRREGVDTAPEPLMEFLREKIVAALETGNRSPGERERYLSEIYLWDAIESARRFVEKEQSH